MDNDPHLWEALGNAWRDNLIALGVSMLSGLATYLHKVTRGNGQFSLMTMIADIAMSGLAGLLMFWVCTEWRVSAWMTGVIVGISGHSAPRMIFLLDTIVTKWLGKNSDV